MDAPTPIATKTSGVERWFGKIIGELQSNRETPTTSIPADAVADVRDKFRLWAGNIGARNAPESAFSLESRLAAASELLDQVADLLGDLADALDDLFEIIVGNHDNRTIESLEPPPLRPGQAQERPTEKDEAHDILDIASECIRSLFRISVLIRKATPRDRFSKALQTSSNRKRPFLDQFDISHVAERYPKLKKEESRWLCERLGRAITKRRQFLRYLDDHRSRVAGGPEWTEEAEEEEVTKSILAKNTLVSGDSRAKPPGSAAATNIGTASEGAHTRPSTKASTLDVVKLALLKAGDPEKEDNRSYVSAGSSFQMTGGDDTALRLPTLVEVSKGEAMFECPFCFGIQTMSKESEWRQHAFHDLRAYVCTLGSAECDMHFFGDSRTWFDHEMQCHRRKWTCILCQEGPFKSPQDMEAHSRSKHAIVLTHDTQLQVIVDASQRSVDALPARDCPFCDEWDDSLKADAPVPDGIPASEVVMTVDPSQFRRHVAFHQEQLALFAIPRVSGDGHHEQEPHDSLNRSLSSLGRRLESEGGDGDPDSQGDLWLPDPPLLIAVASGNLAEVERLLREGADPEAEGETWGGISQAALSRQPTSYQYLEEVQDLVRLYTRGYYQLTEGYNRQGDATECTTEEDRLRLRSDASYAQARYEQEPKPNVPDRIKASAGLENNAASKVVRRQRSVPKSTLERTAFQNRLGPIPVHQQAAFRRELEDVETIPRRDGPIRLRPRRPSPPRRPNMYDDFDEVGKDYHYTNPSSLAAYDIGHHFRPRRPNPDSAHRAPFQNREDERGAEMGYRRPIEVRDDNNLAPLNDRRRTFASGDDIHLDRSPPPPLTSRPSRTARFEDSVVESRGFGIRSPYPASTTARSMRFPDEPETWRAPASPPVPTYEDDDVVIRVPASRPAAFYGDSEVITRPAQGSQLRRRSYHDPQEGRTHSVDLRYERDQPERRSSMYDERFANTADSQKRRRNPDYDSSDPGGPWRGPRIPEQNADDVPSRLDSDRYRERYRERYGDTDRDRERELDRGRGRDYSPRRRRDRDGVRERYRGEEGPPATQFVQERIEPSRVRIVDPDTAHDRDGEKKPEPIKGILKPPTTRFPEDPHPIREGVAPHKDDKKKSEVPAGAKWTRIQRKLVSPEALTIGKERFEIRDEFVIVLRILSKEEIMAYAQATKILRERRRREASTKAVDEWVMVSDTPEKAPHRPGSPA